MKLTLLGVRGSTPSPAEHMVRYGGNTSCVAVSATADVEPTLLLDAGTGLRRLPTVCSTPAWHGSIVLTHVHWDHMQGIPFCPQIDRDEAVVDVYVPAQLGMSGHDLLARAMSPPSFPILPSEMKGAWTFLDLEPGKHMVEGFTVVAAEVRHKGGRTFGYRVEGETGSFAYVPDHNIARGVSDEAREMLSGVDVLLHGGQFVQSESARADDFGHATIDDAIALALQSDVSRMVLIHHSSVRTDDQLDDLAAGLKAPLPVTFGFEGMTLEIG